ncbi:MAG TPA: alkaline phosphatase family protein [Candidatus Limnocylindrales bacterium]|nr:alkaline phosphatase family protein [Candidatus Limnocylindrales bacterium]
MHACHRAFRPAGALALTVALLLPAVAAAKSPTPSNGAAKQANAGVQRIFVIMLENHSQSTVIGDVNAPYITHLAHTYGEATNYYGVTHPSQPNYVAAITGALDYTIMNDNATNTYDRPNLADQIEASGKTWGAYMDAMPSVGFTGAQWPDYTALYSNKHNPFVLMDDIRSDSARLAHIKPYTDLAADLDSGHAPDFVWISPNQCNDMHGGVYTAVPGHPETPCPYGNTVDDPADASLKAKADAFVQGAVETITTSQAWTANSVIVILTDEADFSGTATETDLWADVSGCCDSPGYGSAPPLPYGYEFMDNGPGHFWYTGKFGGGLVPAIVIARGAKHHLVDARAYNHYSLLATIEKVWHLGYLGYAADHANVKTMMKLFAGG